MVTMRSIFAYFWKAPERVVFFVACCAVTWYLVWKYKDKTAILLRNKIVIPASILIVLFLNPISTHFLVSRVEETQYLRFFWLIPVAILLAAVTVLVICRLRQRKAKVVVAAALSVLLLAFGGNFARLTITWENARPNWYKIPQSVIELCDYIEQDDAQPEKRAVFPYPMNLWVRQYCPEIEMPFAWGSIDGIEKINADLYTEISKHNIEPINLREVARMSAEKGYYYVVLWADGDYLNSMEDGGYEEIYRVNKGAAENAGPYDEEYILYRMAQGKVS